MCLSAAAAHLLQARNPWFFWLGVVMMCLIFSRLPWALPFLPLSCGGLPCAHPEGPHVCGAGCWAAQVSHVLELVLWRGACPKSRILPLSFNRAYNQDGTGAGGGSCRWVTVARGNGGPEFQLLSSEQPRPLNCLWSRYSWDLFLSKGSGQSDGLQNSKSEMLVEKATVQVQQHILIYQLFFICFSLFYRHLPLCRVLWTSEEHHRWAKRQRVLVFLGQSS